jgi:hypothetical protein
MIERTSANDENAITYRLTGTVVADDVKQAVCSDEKLAAGASSRSLVFTVDPEFDGYWAEVLRGLRALADEDGCATRIARVAIIIPPDMRGEYETSPVLEMAIECRAFTSLEDDQARHWLAS